MSITVIGMDSNAPIGPNSHPHMKKETNTTEGDRLSFLPVDKKAFNHYSVDFMDYTDFVALLVVFNLRNLWFKYKVEVISGNA